MEEENKNVEENVENNNVEENKVENNVEVNNEQNTVESTNEVETTPVKEEKTKKSSNKTITGLLLVIIALLIVAIVLIIVFMKPNDKKSNNTEKENNKNTVVENKDVVENKETVENKENVENVENTEKEEKTENLNISEEEIKTQINDIYNKLYTKVAMGMFNGLDNNNKLALVLDKLEFENPHSSGENSYNDLYDISIDAVKKAYYDIYGEELIDYISTEAISHCAYYRYDEDTSRYIKSVSPCDIGMGWLNGDYIYNYEITEDEAYIYTAINIYNGVEGYYIVTDNDCRDKNHYYEECIFTTNDIHKEPQFKLDETNYQFFSKYKLSFKRQDDKYYLKKVEKIENGEGYHE